jgi:hypothetical protein
LIGHIFKKDWKLLWPMAALVTIIQFGLEWAAYSGGFFGEDPAAKVLLPPLTLAWFIGIAALAAAVVHQDAIPGVDQDWLIRPLSRTHLLLAKLGFVLLIITVPMTVSNLADAMASGFALLPSLKAVVSKELFVLACFLVPVLALASTTRNMTDLVIIAAALVVAFALSLSLSAFFFGAGWCPTCSSGMSWLQHIVQHIGILAGAGVILVLQYYRRQTHLSRVLAVAGSVALVFAQLPWSTAFAVEQWIAADAAASAVDLTLAAAVPKSADAASGGTKMPGSGQAAQMLLHGRVGQAVENLRRHVRAGNAPVTVELAVQAGGLSADELMLADRIDMKLAAPDGRLLYQGDNAGALAGLFMPGSGLAGDSPGPTYQTVEIPAKAYGARAPASLQLQLRYSLTLMKEVAEHRVPALGGEIQSSDVGICVTMNDRNALYLGCKTIGQAPFCYSATLFASDGRHNPPVLKCTPDYRRHVPAFMNMLSLYGIDMPIRDRNGVINYPVDPSQLAASYVVFRIYGERSHFQRTVTVPASS